ncbi:MAG: molybdopterin-binding/glycosyltransferase family 2 protein [Amylibacter sp.]|jgi:molybdenum cofactor cytidylyltransferase|nr:molybdopterin-binding/glycosyltransferase family 2 protein [Amylibacter sp.]
MKFGPVPTAHAIGHTLAHSLTQGGFRLPKGHQITSSDALKLTILGITSLTVAQLEANDIDENTAAAQLAASVECENIRITEPFSGRVNLIAKGSGVLRIKSANIAAFNEIDEAITIATLPDYARVFDGTLLATIKIIPYAAAQNSVMQVAKTLGPDTLTLHPMGLKTARLILTETPNFKPSLLAKGEAAVRARTTALGLDLQSVETVAHTETAVADALQSGAADLTLILGASATSDRQDVAPAGLVSAGGTLTRFGMPVDPGNLLFFGALNGNPVVGLPGCARSPALNGTDWVLERLCAKLPVTSQGIAAMGVGGLLKEVPARPQPRRSLPIKQGKPHVLLLAAGKSSRMRGQNKLLRQIDGTPLVVRTAKRLAQSNAGGMTIVINPETVGLAVAVQGQGDQIIQAKDANSGLAVSLRAGINALPKTATAVIIALADMPDVTAQDIDALIAAFDPANGALIVAPTAPNGKRGNPVLFDRRYFEPLASLTGDTGAKALIEAEISNLCLVPRGAGVLVDLDTPEAWDVWEQSNT